MSIVAGVDFGTLSVRVSIFDSAKGRLGSGVAQYPLLRKKDDPDHATQSHADHMKALAEATHRAIEAAAVDGNAIDAIVLIDVPAGKQLDTVELHDSLFSTGTSVSVR